MTYGGKNTWVKLKNKIPVNLVYFTAWVGKDGVLNFRDDIYGHVAVISGRDFTKPNISL